MNPRTHSTGLHRMRAAVLFSVIASSFAGLPAAQAGTIDEPRERVTFSDLDVAHPEGAAVLYGRIVAAARRVCSPYWATTFEAQIKADDCVRSAVAAAVTSVDQPALSEVYKTRTPRPLRQASFREE